MVRIRVRARIRARVRVTVRVRVSRQLVARLERAPLIERGDEGEVAHRVVPHHGEGVLGGVRVAKGQLDELDRAIVGVDVPRQLGRALQQLHEPLLPVLVAILLSRAQLPLLQLQPRARKRGRLVNPAAAAARLEGARERVGRRREAAGEAMSRWHTLGNAAAAAALARLELLEPRALPGLGLGLGLGFGVRVRARGFEGFEG